MPQFEISGFEYLVIAGYLALIVAVGIVFKNFSTNTDDYFKGGSRGTWWLVGISSFMSAFSAWTFTGYFFNFLVVGPWLRQLRVTTFPEAINMRFGEQTRNFYAFYEVPIRILYSAMALYAMAIFCSTALGYNIKHVIIVCGIIVLFYSATGGRWAVYLSLGSVWISLADLVVCLKKFRNRG